jgi:DNA-binding response OmpR family regulator
MLPYVDGWEVLAHAQQLPHDRRPKVILVSAVAGVAEEVRAHELGIGCFLPKPFDMDDLVRMVGEALQAA